MGKKKSSKKGAAESPVQQTTKPKPPNATVKLAVTLAEIKVELS